MRSGNDEVKVGALETLGNLAFQPQNRAAFLADADLLEWISRLARDQVRCDGGVLEILRPFAVTDALAMHACRCWLGRPFCLQPCGCVQQQQAQLAFCVGCWSHCCVQTACSCQKECVLPKGDTEAPGAQLQLRCGSMLSGRCPAQVEGLKKRVSVAAIRALAILGQNDEVWQAVGRPGHSGRGVRILAMDGGGMKVWRLLLQFWTGGASERCLFTMSTLMSRETCQPGWHTAGHLVLSTQKLQPLTACRLCGRWSLSGRRLSCVDMACFSVELFHTPRSSSFQAHPLCRA